MTPVLQSTRWTRVIVLWLCGVLAAMQFSKISFVFLALQTQYAITPAQTGLLLSTVGMVGLVLGVTVGLFAPAIGYRRLLLAGMGLGAVLAFLQSLTPGYLLFWVTRMLEGASHLAVVVAAPTLIVANCAPRHRAIAMGFWSTFVGVAFALTAATGGWIVSQFQITGLLLLHAAGMALMFVATLTWVPADTEAPPEHHWPQLSALPRHHLMVYAQWKTALPGTCFFFYTLMAISLMTFIPQYGGPDSSWLAGLAGGSAYALIPHLNDQPAMQARATGAIAQLGNLGSTLGPPVFAYLMGSLGTMGLTLPVVLFALMGVGTATLGIRRLGQVKTGNH